ncbi:MAG: diguanylate cyclase [Thermodesulfobacteriota bacterium]
MSIGICLDSLISHTAFQTVYYVLWTALGLLLSAAVCNYIFQPQKLKKIVEERTSQLADSQKKYKGIFDESASAIIMFDKEMRFVDSNRAGIDLLGYSREELLAMTFAEMDANPDVALPVHRQVLSGEVINNYEHLLVRKDGRVVAVLNSSRPLFDDDGSVTGIQATLIDITRRKHLEWKLQESEVKYRGLVEYSHDWIWEMDSQGRYTYSSPQVESILGYRSEEIVNMTAFDVMEAGEAEKLVATYQGREEDEDSIITVTIENIFLHNDGNKVILETRGAPFFDNMGMAAGFRGIGRDITAKKQQEEILKRQATIDSLTGLPNRSLFMDRLQREVLHSKRLGNSFALLFVDLDQFKEVNDSMGHAAGDLLLSQVAQRYTGVVRESDTVARLGGDEFVVMLSNIPKSDDIARIAQILVNVSSRPFWVNNQEVQIGASIGISRYPRDSDNADTLLVQADSAMYRSKQSGRSRFCFFEAIPGDEKQRLINYSLSGMTKSAQPRSKVTSEERRTEQSAH